MKNNMTEPWEDPIVAEVRAARLSLLAAVGHDLNKLGDQLIEEQLLSGHEVVTLPPRKPTNQSGEAA